MASALRGGVGKYPKFADKQSIKFGQRGEGVKKSQNFADVIYGSLLISDVSGPIKFLNKFLVTNHKIRHGLSLRVKLDIILIHFALLGSLSL